MNNQRRIPRLLVRAFSAGTMLAAVALPMAVATEAGASGGPTITATQAYLEIGTGAITTTTGTPGTFVVTGGSTNVGANGALLATGDLVVSTGVNPGTTITSIATGPVFTPSTTIPAASSYVATFYAPTATVGASTGNSGELVITGSGFATSGTPTITSSAPGVTFANSVAGSSTTLLTDFSTSASAAAGYYSVTSTDANGTSNAFANGLVMTAAPTVTAVSPASAAQNSTTTLTISGSGFQGTTSSTLPVVLTSTVDATTLSGNAAWVNSGTLTLSSLSLSRATVGTYTVSVNNPDGGSVTSAALFTVTGPSITAITPGSIAIPALGAATTSTVVTVTGTGFVNGAYVTLTSPGSGVGPTGPSPVTFISATQVSFTVTVANTASAHVEGFTITNPDGSAATAAASATGLGLGIGEANYAQPTITGVTGPALSVGNSGAISITGTGFGPAGSPVAVSFTNNLGAADGNLACTSPVVISDTQISCVVTASTGVFTGLHGVVVTARVASANFANGVTVTGGLTISSITPSVIVANQQTTFVIMGSGFASTNYYNINGAGWANSSTVFTYVSSSEVKITATLTAPGTETIGLADASTPSYQSVVSVSVGGIVPSVTSVTYPASTTDVGLGATAVPVVINGTGFLTGATIADTTQSSVTFTVTSVTPTSISATVTVPATAMFKTDSITVTNTNGGVSGAFNFVIGAGPGASSASAASTGALSVSPSASVLAGATKTLTLSSTGGVFATGVKVTSSSALLTVGTVAINADGTLSVPVTAISMTGTNNVGATLTVKNPDGGTASVALTVNPGPTVAGTYYVPTFSTNVQLVVSGTGFETGMTASSANSDYTVVLGGVVGAVPGSNVTSAILVVTTTSAATAGTSSVVTFTNPDGGKVSFPLNGGPVPTPVVTSGQPHVTGVSTFVKTGMTRAITLTGLHFAKGLTIHSVAGTTWKVMGVSPTAVRVQVTVTKASKIGWHRLYLTNPNGKSTSRAYQQK